MGIRCPTNYLTFQKSHMKNVSPYELSYNHSSNIGLVVFKISWDVETILHQLSPTLYRSLSKATLEKILYMGSIVPWYLSKMETTLVLSQSRNNQQIHSTSILVPLWWENLIDYCQKLKWNNNYIETTIIVKQQKMHSLNNKKV